MNKYLPHIVATSIFIFIIVAFFTVNIFKNYNEKTIRTDKQSFLSWPYWKYMDMGIILCLKKTGIEIK